MQWMSRFTGFPEVPWSRRRTSSWGSLFSGHVHNLDQVVKDQGWIEKFVVKRMVDALPEGNIKPSYDAFFREMTEMKTYPPGATLLPVSG